MTVAAVEAVAAEVAVVDVVAAPQLREESTTTKVKGMATRMSTTVGPRGGAGADTAAATAGVAAEPSTTPPEANPEGERGTAPAPAVAVAHETECGKTRASEPTVVGVRGPRGLCLRLLLSSFRFVTSLFFLS